MKIYLVLILLAVGACDRSSQDEDSQKSNLPQTMTSNDSEGDSATDESKPADQSSAETLDKAPVNPATMPPAAIDQLISKAEADAKKIIDTANKYAADTVLLERVKRMTDALLELKTKKDEASNFAFCRTLTTIVTRSAVSLDMSDTDRDVIVGAVGSMRMAGAACETLGRP